MARAAAPPARVRRPRPAPRGPHARLRAAQAAQPALGAVPRAVLRLALPGAEELLEPRPDRRDRRPPPAPHAASRRADRLRAHRRRQGALPRPGRRAGPPRGRTTTSTCASPSSPAPSARSGCASSRAAAAALAGAPRAASATPRARSRERLDRYTVELQRHGVESVEREVRWLTELIDAERAPPRRPRPPAAGASRSHRPPQHQPRPATAAPTRQGEAHGFRTRSHRRRRQLRHVPGPGRASTTGTPTRPSTVPGLMHVKFGDYHVSDVEFVAAFDVDDKKVGKDLVRGHQRLREQHHQDRRRAHHSASPCSAATPSTASASTTARPSRSPTPSRSTSSQALKDAKVDVLVSYLPVGSEEADKFYAQCAIDAGVAFVNALPGVHRLRPRVGREVRGRRRPDHRRRHQVARSAPPSRTA